MNTLRLAKSLDFVLRQERMHLYLIHRRDDFRRAQQVFERLHAEVADANRAHFTACEQLLHVRPRIVEGRVLARRYHRSKPVFALHSLREMHQIQIDVVESESGERSIEGFFYFVMI